MGFFQPLFVRFPAAFPVAGILLLTVYPFLAGFAIFRPVGMGNERRTADGASLHAVPVVNLRLQRLVQRQDRPAEPLAADGECEHLRTGAGVAIVQRKAVAVVAVAALPAYQAAGPFPLRRGHAVGGAVRPVFQRRQVLIGSFFHTVPPFFGFQGACPSMNYPKSTLK